MNYLSIGYDTPRKGQSLKCIRFNASNYTLNQLLENFDSLIVEDVITGTARNIEWLCPNIFKVENMYSTYIYQVHAPLSEIIAPRTYIAFTNEMPKAGYCFECYRLKYNSRFPEHVLISSVTEVENIASDIYKVSTNSSIYIVQVLK